MPTPDIIHRLVKRFEEHRDSYLSGKYNETQLRSEFLDPFFEALGLRGQGEIIVGIRYAHPNLQGTVRVSVTGTLINGAAIIGWMKLSGK
jgi:hypothetical protein